MQRTNKNIQIRKQFSRKSQKHSESTLSSFSSDSLNNNNNNKQQISTESSQGSNNNVEDQKYQQKNLNTKNNKIYSTDNKENQSEQQQQLIQESLKNLKNKQQQIVSKKDILSIMSPQINGRKSCQEQKIQGIPFIGSPSTISHVNEILPIKISSLSIRKLKWSDFKGIPNYQETYNAHIFWHISYNYDVEMRAVYGRKVNYNVKIRTQVNVRDKSWNKVKNDGLLSHEQGHYLLGCLCALNFEKLVQGKSFTSNYKQEINKIFQQNLKQWVDIEIDYDNETEHRLNFDEQGRWDRFIINKLSEFYNHFNVRKSLLEDEYQQFQKTKQNFKTEKRDSSKWKF